MSSLEAILSDILQELTPSSEDRQSYTKDADAIRDYIIGKMKESDTLFRSCFAGNSLAGSYLDDLKIRKPDEFDINVVLKPPFSVRVEKEGSLIYLKAVGGGSSVPWNAARSYGQYISHSKLQTWFREIVKSVFGGRYLKLNVNGREYQLEYPLKGYAVAHTICAKDLKDSKREIWFDFVPAFEFRREQWVFSREYKPNDLNWFAVPMADREDEFTFNVTAPHPEREIFKNKQNLKNSLRLMKAIRDANDMTLIQSYVLKTIYLWEIDRRKNSYWDQPMGAILAEMVSLLIEYLEKGFMPFYWNKNVNMLERVLGKGKEKDFKQKWQNVLNILKEKPINPNLRTVFGV